MATYHEDNRRTLQKVYGLKILVTIAGEGRRFDFLTLILTLGATVGLFALVSLYKLFFKKYAMQYYSRLLFKMLTGLLLLYNFSGTPRV